MEHQNFWPQMTFSYQLKALYSFDSIRLPTAQISLRRFELVNSGWPGWPRSKANLKLSKNLRRVCLVVNRGKTFSKWTSDLHKLLRVKFFIIQKHSKCVFSHTLTNTYKFIIIYDAYMWCTRLEFFQRVHSRRVKWISKLKPKSLRDKALVMTVILVWSRGPSTFTWDRSLFVVRTVQFLLDPKW